MPAPTAGHGQGQPAHGLSGPLVAVAALMALSVLLRTGMLDGVGEYSDIVHLYRRDDLAAHPAPYFDYRLEYPVLTGLFQWLAAFAGASDELYFVVSAAALTALALATVRLLGDIRGANAWLLAATPAVVFWGVQNWDFLGICPLVAALVLHQRGRDAWGAAALALAVSAKLFPIVVLPVVLVVRLAEGRRRAVPVIVGAFALVTVVLNGPVAIELGDGMSVRDSWTFFFEFNRDRPAENTLWSSAYDAVPDVNRASGLMLVTGLGALLALTFRSVRSGQDCLLLATAGALLWLFATGKVYSAQYALWILLALCLASAPVAAAAVFVAIDVVFFVTLWGGLPWLGDQPPEAARQIWTAGLALYVALRLMHTTDDRDRAGPVAREARSAA